MKDNFSLQAEGYARYRPGYTHELFAYLEGLPLPGKNCAWDCATGNGQIARGLAPFFKTVYATDISAQQLANALPADNILYRQETAEASSFAAQSFDLIVVAQAIHWFDFDRFYAEVHRTLKPGGALVVTGYDLLQITPEIDRILHEFYEGETGPYWDPERKWVDEQYKTIPFPFREVSTPQYAYEQDWSLEHLLGYVATWSAVQHYKRQRGTDPVALLRERLLPVWETGVKHKVVFPLLLRVGYV